MPDISVVVPSHGRPMRLRWLLNALEEQTLDRSRWELVVVHDNAGDETEDLLRTHPLAAAGVLRHVRLPANTGPPARQRNVGWREARSPLIAFTDDDCRPTERWLEELLHAMEANPGAIVHGRTKPDPNEAEIMDKAPRPRSIDVDPPPGLHAQTCNIGYPRALLEEVGGFDEEYSFAGEDLDLCTRGRKAGAAYVGAPDALAYHAVDTFLLPTLVWRNRRWESLALLYRRHPELRRDHLFYRVFWKDRHVWLLPALAALPLHRREPLLALLALPYVLYALPHRGSHPVGRMRASVELLGRVVEDVGEMAVLVRGSIRHRALIL